MEPQTPEQMTTKRNLKGVGRFAGLALAIATGVALGNFLTAPAEYAEQDYGYEEETSWDYEGCNVAGVTLRGDLYTYVLPSSGSEDEGEYVDAVGSEDLTYIIEVADADENIRAILLEVDSYGGSPVAGEEVAYSVKMATKPVIAFIRDGAASAAYWAVSPADKIFASKNSDVGSIGVTSSYLNNVEKNKNEGYTLESLSVGKYKDIGVPDRALSSEEKELILRDLKIIHENFIAAVAENRALAVEAVRAIADGSTVLGEQAKTLGLIDEIGGYYEAKKYIEEEIGEEAEICW